MKATKYSHARENYAKTMRRYHNNIKTTLIEQSVHAVRGDRPSPSRLTLLDIGVGRGGDINKWHKCNVDTVVGYDVEHTYVNEAFNRYLTICNRRNYNFYTCIDMEELLRIQPVHTFDVVSCQFAIHYFFESERKLRGLIQNVSNVLEHGGLFIGTFMNGDKLLRLPLNRDNVFMNTAFMVHYPECGYPSKTRTFGQQVSVHLTGTLYFGEQSVSLEYVVKPDILRSVCEEYGLSLVRFQDFDDYNITGYKNHAHYQHCSNMYTTFVFRKQSL
jgi:mRNA (guanine-N7-)-methyltransferase